MILVAMRGKGYFLKSHFTDDCDEWMRDYVSSGPSSSHMAIFGFFLWSIPDIIQTDKQFAFTLETLHVF